MKKIFKVINIFLLILIMAVSVVGCGRGGSGGGRDGKTTITFMHIWPEHAKKVNEIVTDFMSENEDIIVSPTYVPYTEIDRTLQSAFYGGEMPDVFFQWTHYMYKWVPDDIPMDLTFLYDELKSDYLQDGVAWEAGKINGKYYNAPFRSTGFLVAYNKTIFENQGWKVPETFQDFENVMKDAKKDFATPFALYGGNGGTLTQINTAFGIFRDIMAGAVEDPNYRTGRLRPNMEDDSSARLIEKLKNWMDLGYFGSGAMGRKREDVMNLFMSGQTPMCLFNNNEMGTLSEGMINDMEIGVFAFPAPAGVDFKYVFGGFDGFCISSTTKHKEAAVKFLKYLLSVDVQQSWTNTEKSIMVNKNVKYEEESQRKIAEEMLYAGKYDQYADYNGGQYLERNATLLNDFLSGSYNKGADQLIKDMINNTYTGMKDSLLNPPNGLDWIDPVYVPKEYDRSWIVSDK